MGKPVVLFTNFWDANNLLSKKHFLVDVNGSIYRIRLEKDQYSIYSIALSHPPVEKLPDIKSQFGGFKRLDFFCPTYKLLMRYKNDKNWEWYTEDFNSLMKDRKSEIKDWIDSLVENHLYILCCWENTSRDSKCHRELIYKAITSSRKLKDKCFYVYRDGGDTVSTLSNFNKDVISSDAWEVPF